ncbi:hypothetical protein D3C81_1687870 [compost metagenome]
MFDFASTQNGSACKPDPVPARDRDKSPPKLLLHRIQGMIRNLVEQPMGIFPSRLESYFRIPAQVSLSSQEIMAACGVDFKRPSFSDPNLFQIRQEVCGQPAKQA